VAEHRQGGSPVRGAPAPDLVLIAPDDSFDGWNDSSNVIPVCQAVPKELNETAFAESGD
jgi:hypothetical protein